MATTRWEPLRDLAALQERVNRIFEDVIMPQRRGAEEEDPTAGQWSPSADIFETADSLVIRLEVSGLAPQSVEVELLENRLVVRGERKFEEVDGRHYHQVERAYGTFRRVFSIPMQVKQDQIHALLRHGVLEITLLKAEKVNPTRVQVEVL